MAGNEGADALLGLSGHDILLAAGGDDLLSDESGYDRLFGGAGEDVLFEGEGQDYLVGGAGRDCFVFTPPSGNEVDIIKDSNPNFDQLCFLTRHGKADQAGFENLNMQTHHQNLWIDFAGRSIFGVYSDRRRVVNFAVGSTPGGGEFRYSRRFHIE